MCRGCGNRPNVVVRAPTTPSAPKPKPKATPREKVMGNKREPK
jgi:hypothetical protein